MSTRTTGATQTADVVIIGGGLSGCALAIALSDGKRKILVLEARAGKNPRFNGELIHPTGVDVLAELGALPDLQARGGTEVQGFACVAGPGQEPMTLDYAEIADARPFGFAIDHRDLVDVMRARALATAGVEIRTGERVTRMLYDEERVVGVVSTSGPVSAKLVLACDGRHSKTRSLLGIEERARLISFTAAALLEDCQLPRPGYGHIFLGAWGPILVYPIARDGNTARTCIDIAATDDDNASGDDKKKGRGKEALLAKLREGYAPFLPPSVRASLERAIDTQDIEVAANYAIYTDECVVPGAALVGDACGCSHPITATGMTIALNDVRTLAEALRTVPLDQPRAVDAAMARYQSERYRYVRAREILADALYEVFRGIDEGTRAIRAGIFSYWQAANGNRARSMALLSGRESRLPAFMREYLTVAALSASTALRGQVNDPSLGGRLRSLVGLGKKSVEKFGLVARGVREGSLSLRLGA